MKKKITITLTLLLFFSLTYSQTATVSSGTDISTSAGSVSYSVGQINYEAVNSSDGSNLQGVQQAYEIYVVSEIENINDSHLNINLIQDGRGEFVILAIDNPQEMAMHYQLLNINGQLIRKQEIEQEKTSINLQELSSSVYFLSISLKNKRIKTFKIIKK